MIILIESTMMKLHLNVHLAFLHFGLLEKERKIRVKKIGRAEAILVYFDMSHMRIRSETVLHGVHMITAVSLLWLCVKYKLY